MALRLRGQTGTVPPPRDPRDPVVTTTPSGKTRQPGFFNPYNPEDTGRHGEQNKELLPPGTTGGKVEWWDYDLGQPKPGVTLNEQGYYGPTSGTSGAGGGGLGNNPMFDQMSSLFQSQSIADAAARREAIQKALISFGLVPEGFQDKYGDITDLVRQLAGKNTSSGISTYARLLESRKEGLAALINRLTARGLRRSGAKGAGLRKTQLGFDRNYADSLQSLMSYIQNAYSGFSNNEYQRALALMQAQAQFFDYYGGGGGGGAAPNYSQVIPFDPNKAVGTNTFAYLASPTFAGGGATKPSGTSLNYGYQTNVPYQRISGFQV